MVKKKLKDFLEQMVLETPRNILEGHFELIYNPAKKNNKRPKRKEDTYELLITTKDFVNKDGHYKHGVMMTRESIESLHEGYPHETIAKCFDKFIEFIIIAIDKNNQNLKEK